METRGWRREGKELEHNDLDTGTFFNTSDWPANIHILAVNTHMHTHRKTHILYWKPRWGQRSSKMSTELKSTWHLSNSELIWNLSTPGKVRATVVKLMIVTLLWIVCQCSPSSPSVSALSLSVSLLFFSQLLFLFSYLHLTASCCSMSWNVTAPATVDLIYLAEQHTAFSCGILRSWNK